MHGKVAIKKDLFFLGVTKTINSLHGLETAGMCYSLVHSFSCSAHNKKIFCIDSTQRVKTKSVAWYDQAILTLYQGSIMLEEFILSATKGAARSLPGLNVLRENFPKNLTTQEISNFSDALDQLHNNLLKLKTALNLRKSENLMHEYLAKSFHQSHQSSIED